MMGKKKEFDPCDDSKTILKEINVNVNCCNNRLTSVFRAERNSTQPLPGGVPYTQVLYPEQKLDTNNEYDPVTSTFIPQQNGVYSFIASIQFFPDEVPNTPWWLFLEIRVNNTAVAADLEYLPTSVVEGQVSVSVIQQLQAGDKVTVFVRSSNKGIIITNSPYQTRFEGTRTG